MKWIVSLFFAFACLFWASWKTPYYCDDNTYRLEYCHGPHGGVSGFGDTCEYDTLGEKAKNLLRVGWHHYTHENGRFATAIPLRLFVGCPRWLYAAVNASMFVLLCWLIWLHTGLGGKWRIPILFAGCLFLLKSDAVLWLAASINYLWPAVLVLTLVQLFKTDRFTHGRHLLWTVPLSFVAAGGHEIVSVPVCLILAVFWLRQWIEARRIFLNGRFAMSFAFGLGAITIFLSPVSPLFRAGYESASSTAYLVLCKLFTLVNCFLGSPFLVPLLVIAVWLLWKRGFSYFSARRGYWMVFLIVLLGFTVVFGNICARAAWPVNVVSMIVFFIVVPDALAKCKKLRLVSVVIVCLLGAITLLNTAIAAEINGRGHLAALADYLKRDNGIYVIPDRCDWLLGLLCDRTIDPRSVVQVGHGATCTNGNYAKVLGRPVIIGLFARENEAMESGRLFAPDAVILSEGEWYAIDGVDLIACEGLASNETYNICKPIQAKISYQGLPLPSGRYVSHLAQMIADRACRCSGGIGLFSSQEFMEMLIRDVLYTSAYLKNPQRGFHYRHGNQIYRVYIHNHFADRSHIVNIKN